MKKEGVLANSTTVGELGFPLAWHRCFQDAWDESGKPPWSHEDRMAVPVRTRTWQTKFVETFGDSVAVTWRGVIHFTETWERAYGRIQWPDRSPLYHDVHAFISLAHEMLHAWEQRTQRLTSRIPFLKWIANEYAPPLFEPFLLPLPSFRQWARKEYVPHLRKTWLSIFRHMVDHLFTPLRKETRAFLRSALRDEIALLRDHAVLRGRNHPLEEDAYAFQDLVRRKLYALLANEGKAPHATWGAFCANTPALVTFFVYGTVCNLLVNKANREVRNDAQHSRIVRKIGI